MDEIELTLRQFAVDTMLDYGLANNRAEVEKSILHNAYLLHMAHRAPSIVLQEERLITKHPATKWDWLKEFIPFAKPKYKEYYLSEFITFPDMEIPLQEKNPKIYWEIGTHTYWKNELCD